MRVRALTAALAIAVVAVGVVGIGALVDHQRDKSREQQVIETQRKEHLRGVATSKPTVVDVGSSAGGHEKGSHGSGGDHVLVPPGTSGERPSASDKPGSVGSRATSESDAASVSRDAGASAAAGSAGSQDAGSGSDSKQKQKSLGGQNQNDDSDIPRYRVVGNSSNRCIDITDQIYSAPDRTPLQLFDCGNNGNQQWTFYSDGTIRSLGKCMGVVGGSTANGAVVDVYTCNGSAGQRWRFEKAGDLVNVLADKCVDAKDHGTANGTRLQLYTCAGTDNQKWHVA